MTKESQHPEQNNISKWIELNPDLDTSTGANVEVLRQIIDGKIQDKVTSIKNVHKIRQELPVGSTIALQFNEPKQVGSQLEVLTYAIMASTELVEITIGKGQIITLKTPVKGNFLFEGHWRITPRSAEEGHILILEKLPESQDD